jgi:hypothetical protein
MDMLLSMSCISGWSDELQSFPFYCEDRRVIRRIIERAQIAKGPFFVKLLPYITHSSDVELVLLAVNTILEGMSKDDPGVRVEDKDEALANVASHYHQETAALLLKFGARPSPECLINAVKSLNVQAVEHFLDLKVDANRIVLPQPRPPSGAPPPWVPMNTALSEAIRHRFDEALNLFEGKGFISKAVDDPCSFVSVLAAASGAKNVDLMERLVRLHGRPWVLDLPDYNQYLNSHHHYPIDKSLKRALSEVLDSALRSSMFEMSNYLLVLGATPSFDLILHSINSRDYDLLETVLQILTPLWNDLLSEDAWDLSHLMREIIDQISEPGTLRSILKAGLPVEPVFPIDNIFDIPGYHHGSFRVDLLTAAVLFENSLIVNKLLEAGTCLDSIKSELSPRVITPLAAAAWVNNLAYIDHFLSCGADPADNMALLLACKSNNNVAMQKILDQFCEHYPRKIRTFGFDGLVYAIRSGDLSQVSCILNATGIPEAAPISLAVSCRKLEILRILLERGGDPNSILGMTARHPIKHGPDEIMTPVLQAISSGQLPVIQELVEHGANLHRPARHGLRRTALQTAAEYGAMDIVQYLLQQNVDVNEAPALWRGATALQCASIKGHAGIADILVTAGADVNAAPAISDGRTAFEGATEHGRIDMMFYLFEKGADLLSNGARQYRRAVYYAKQNEQSAACEIAEKLYQEAQKREREGVPIFGTDGSDYRTPTQDFNGWGTTAGNLGPTSLGTGSNFSNNDLGTRLSGDTGETGTFDLDGWLVNPCPEAVRDFGGF